MNPGLLEFAAIQRRQQVSLWRHLFSFPVALCSLLCLLAVLTVCSRVSDPDLWWHLRMGQFLWTHSSAPLTDPFSFTARGQTIVPHEWLPQLSLFAVFHWFGFSGLMLWLTGFTSAILIAGYALCCACSRNAKVSFAGAIVLWLFSTVGLAARPHLVGYLLLILELLILQLARRHSPRWLFALPLLFALWVNCHGSFLLGLIVASVVFACSFFEFWQGALLSQRWTTHARRMFALALLLSGAAVFANPSGLRQVLYPLDTLLHQPINLASVQEWQPLVLSSPRGLGLLAVLAAMFLLILLQKAEIPLDELLLIALGTWLAASHERMLFVFGILAAPTLCRMLSKSWDNYSIVEDRAWPNALLMALTMLGVWWAFPTAASLDHQVALQNPVKAVEFVRARHLAGPMLNDYTYGGYLVWAMPEHPVFIDGRADVYEWAGVLGPYAQWATLQADPHTLLDKYGIQFCLLNPQSQMAHVLPLLPDWKVAYQDDLAVVLQRIAAR